MGIFGALREPSAWFMVLLALAASVSAPASADFIGHGAPVRDIVTSSDGTLALTAGFDDQIIVWDVATREPVHRLVGHEAGVNAAVFVPPGEQRAVSVGDDATVRLWDLREGAELGRWGGHEKKVVSVAVSSDGRLAASASWDRTVRLWEVPSGKLLRVLEGHENNVNAVAFMPGDEALLSAGYDGAIWYWPLDETASPSRLASVGFPINDLAVSADGKRFVTGSADGLLRLWDLETREEIKTFEGHEGAVLAVGLSPDGQTIASGGTDGKLLLWPTEDGEAALSLEVEHYSAVWSIDFSPQGAIVYAGGVDPVARAWFVATGEPVLGSTTAFQPIARAAPGAAESEDPIERGSYHFRKCAVCHSLQDDGVPRAGPSLQGLFGRRVGTYPGYRYSNALADGSLIWTEETVSQLFDLGPDVLLPGTKMPLQRLPDEQARDDLIAFLKRFTAAP